MSKQLKLWKEIVVHIYEPYPMPYFLHPSIKRKDPEYCCAACGCSRAHPVHEDWGERVKLPN